ncbi:shikimate kinase [Chloroflexus islandicus]|uniref:Shikimate kinase n=1 Tax=Chloroflexus islandicus TaxID=1707952 RepID=A0A178MKS3_9CHLR|nr:shikimate kinase [Chloroflexus islandicus]OAN48604.1 shikimate kinase [Chloroflexus islandicus]
MVWDPNWLERPIALIGLSGCGKSTLARLLARALSWPWYDTDAAVAAAAGMSVADLFQTYGEAEFRARESAALCEALREAQVIATGGGIVLQPENRQMLHDRATVIWLDASDATILARLAVDAEERPLLRGDAATRLAALRAARAPLYAALADLTVQTDGVTPIELVQQIITALRKGKEERAG